MKQKKTKIEKVIGCGILDPGGNPTVEVDVILGPGFTDRVSVPFGASIGKYEALELHDDDKKHYGGRGVPRTINNINGIIASKLAGMSTLERMSIDHAMPTLDDTETKSNLGANAILGVSSAVTKTTAAYFDVSLYRHIGGTNTYVISAPMMNIIDGGSRNNTPIALREFMIRPIGATSFHEGLRMDAEVFHALRKVLHDHDLSTAVDDEGGFAPTLAGTEDALDPITTAIKAADYEPSKGVMIAMDCASSEFYHDGVHGYDKFEGEKDKKHTAGEQVSCLEEPINKCPIDSIEGGMSGDDWEGWEKLADRTEGRCQLVGGGPSVTNVGFLATGVEKGCANSVFVKVSRIGSLTETLNVIEIIRRHRCTTATSHRSGEAKDSTVADIIATTSSEQIETGSLSRSDRTARHNQLLCIEGELGSNTIYGYRRIEEGQ